MCGIIVDMTIINILIRNYFPQLIPFLDNKEENYGDYIGNNFINVNLINLFTNEYINENTSLLIWDLLFIDGNMILIKTFLSIYHYLLPFLLESNQSIEDYQNIIKNQMKKLDNDNRDLIFYLVIKEFNFDEEEIEQARFSLSVNTANSINKEKNKYSEKKDKKYEIECNINWPICKYRFTNCINQNNVTFYNVIQRKKKNYIEDYFEEKMKNIKNKDKNNHEDKNLIYDENDLLIERNVHYCNIEKDIDKKEIIKKDNERRNEEKNDKINDEINKEINYNKIINKPEFIEASKNVLNDLQMKLKGDENNEN